MHIPVIILKLRCTANWEFKRPRNDPNYLQMPICVRVFSFKTQTTFSLVFLPCWKGKMVMTVERLWGIRSGFHFCSIKHFWDLACSKFVSLYEFSLGVGSRSRPSPHNNYCSSRTCVSQVKKPETVHKASMYCVWLCTTIISQLGTLNMQIWNCLLLSSCVRK